MLQRLRRRGGHLGRRLQSPKHDLLHLVTGPQRRQSSGRRPGAQPAKVPDFNGYTDVYQVTLDGDLYLKEYSFRINGIPVRDPYGKMAKPGTGDQAVNIVMDMSRTDLVGGWAPRPALVEREDAILYETHVRDFTIDASSGVSPENRGKYLGLVEAGTSHMGVETGLDHLKELGVTHVQLLPVYDFATCDGVPDSDPCYNWGYDPRNFDVPEERCSQRVYEKLSLC